MSTKWCRFETDGRTAYGRLDGDDIVEVNAPPWESYTETGKRYPFAAVKLQVPVVPPTFYCVGFNYKLMKPGDVCEIEISDIGILRNNIIAEQ